MIREEAASSPPELASIPELVPDYDLRMKIVNERVVIHDDEIAGWRVVMVSGVVLATYSQSDATSERHVCVQLRMSGLATQAEIVAAFGHARATQCRWENQYRAEGLSGLFTEPPQGRRSTMPSNVEDAVVTLHAQGLGMRRIAGRLGLTLHEVAGVYKRRSLEPHRRHSQQDLYEESEAAGIASEPEEGEDDEDDSANGPWDGLLVPQYESGSGVAWAGVLLAAPILQRHRVIEVFAELYRSLGLLAVYGLHTMVGLMVYLALWRLKRPEHLKEHSPGDLGRALGLPRAPEVKTVRRKLAQLAAHGKAREAMLALARVRLEQDEELVGFLYVDGHVRAYSGKHEVAKGYSVQRRMSVRATTDTWANDAHGDPLFVVTSEVNEGLTRTLGPVLEQARELAGDERRITVVFDRGGWSPQLFVDLIRSGFDLITYRKGRTEDVPQEEFEERRLLVDGRTYAYWLVDRPRVRVGHTRLDWGDESPRALELREVIRLSRETGHQTQVLTTRSDLAAEQVLWRMFARWRQENFFKYMKEEFSVDGLVEYGWSPVDSSLERANPEHRAISREIAELKVKVARLREQLGDRIGETAQRLEGELREATSALGELEATRTALPEHISAGDLKRLQTERQQLATVFKVAAYNIETELVRMVAPHYSRSEDEGRTLIAAALRSPADLAVTERELRVTLAPQSSPHRSRALAALCADLNNLGSTAPGTDLRIVLDCALHPSSDASF